MAHAEVPPFRNPLERIGHTVREIPVWMGRHWKSVLLITAAGGAAISLNFLHDRGSQNPAVTVNNPISDTLKPADPGAASEVVVPAVVPTEVTPAAGGASASPEPPKPTAIPHSAEPTKVPATPEAPKGFDCSILSPEACANGDYVQWGVWSPSGTVQIQGMAFTLKPGEKVRIPENFVVAASEYQQPHPFKGYSIQGVTRDGKRSLVFIGDITPTNGVTRVGKDFPAETVVGIAGNTGKSVLTDSKYNLLVVFPTEKDLKNAFPDQTQNPPKIIKDEMLEQQPKPRTSGGAVFFDVKPPQTSN